MRLFSCLVFIISISVLASGCSTTSSSSVSYVPEAERYAGKIYLVTGRQVPEDLGYEVVGHVKANARQGYDRVETLYPLLAEEARKVGANAVINVKGGRTVQAFSWAAPFVGGTAVVIDDPEKLIQFGGQYF